MKAYLRSVRIAPKKANLVAKMVRGMSVQDAQYSLERTNKKAARIVEELLKSAVANAKNNDNQDPSILVIKTLIVNKAQSYHRGVPMARGRVRPMRKFLSHIEITLGIAGLDDELKTKKTKEVTSQTEAKKVKSTSSTKKTSSTKSEKSASTSEKKPATAGKKDTAASAKSSAAPKKSAAKKTTPKKES